MCTRLTFLSRFVGLKTKKKSIFCNERLLMDDVKLSALSSSLLEKIQLISQSNHWTSIRFFVTRSFSDLSRRDGNCYQRMQLLEMTKQLKLQRIMRCREVNDSVSGNLLATGLLSVCLLLQKLVIVIDCDHKNHKKMLRWLKINCSV